MFADGVCGVRVYAPQDARFKYELSVGRVTDGTKIFESQKGDKGTGEFWQENYFGEWEAEIANDTVSISLEVLDNLNSVASTQKVVKLQTK